MESPFPAHDSSSADLAFFSSSVFDSAAGESGAADTASLASADISVVRSGSVSSGSSESHSQCARSVHSRSGSLLNQTVPHEGFQAEFATAFGDNSEASPSFGNKDGQEEDSAFESGSHEDKPAPFPPLTDTKREDKSEMPSVLEVSAGLESNPDPFTSSDVSTREDERTQSAGESFFTDSFATFDASLNKLEVKGDSDNSASNDPFATSNSAQEKDTAFECTEGFVLESSFDTAFSSEPFAPSQDSSAVAKDHSQEDKGDEKTVESESSDQYVENTAVNLSWDNAFGDTKTTSQPETTQNNATTEVQFSWMESFASEDVETLPKADPKASTVISWDDAFGGAVATDKESSSQTQGAFSWDDAFGGTASDSGNLQFDSSPFGDPFGPSSTVDSNSDEPSVLQQSEQPASQPIVSNNLELGGTVSESSVQPVSQSEIPLDEAFPSPSSSQCPESDAFVSGTQGSVDQSFPSKDPFEELKISFPGPAIKTDKRDVEESDESSEPEIVNGNEDVIFAKENASSELPSGDNMDKTNEMNEMDNALAFANEETPASDTKEEMDKRETVEIPEGQPSELHIQESTLSISERSISPTVPPPLPPRAVSSTPPPPPPLPARPTTSSSTISTGMSPISPQTSTGSPASNSPRQGKKGSAKKTPPALPPRVDLNEKLQNSSSSKTEAFSDPFGVNLFDQKFDDNKGMTQGGISDWATLWPMPQKTSEEKSKDLSDPFSEDFFTNFDFPQKSSSTTKSDDVDPFASTNPSSELFPSEFGNQDLFAAFTPAKGDSVFDSGDPFKNDSFAAFSSDDPFSDISDPFADKGVLSDDPFSDSPRKPHSGNAFTLNEVCIILCCF